MSTETQHIEQLEFENKSLQKEVDDLNDEIGNITDEKNKEIRELNDYISELESDAEETQSTKEDDPEDCRRSLFFAITELEEVERGDVSLSDKLFDLRMRHCRFL